MSEQNNAPVRGEEPELNDESLEQVAGGCQWGQSATIDVLTVEPTYPICPTVDDCTVA